MKVTLAALLIGAALFFGCGESRQEKFESALREAEAARVDLEAAREQVTQSEARYEETHKAAKRAEAELDASRGELDAASERLETARTEVLKWAPDGALPAGLEPSNPVARPVAEVSGPASSAAAAEPPTSR